MMVIGIICEYNPFHRGHLMQIQKVREQFGESAAIVCLMSGRFVQRGEPAVFHPAVRAEAALSCGADLVLELPVTAALSSAEGFADGAIEILDRSGVIDRLSFGCETDDFALLEETAYQLQSDAFPPALRRYLDEGLPFAAARCKALSDMGGKDSLLTLPNNILGVEYCKALQKRNSSIAIAPITRGSNYHDQVLRQDLPSATAVRNAIGKEQWIHAIPKAAQPLFSSAQQYRLEWGERAMLARLQAMTSEEFRQLPYGTEGLWSKVMKACYASSGLSQILEASKSKRYPRVRLMRMLMCGYLGITQDMICQKPDNIRVLALDQTGGTILRRIKNSGGLQIVHPGETVYTDYARMEERCARLYQLFGDPQKGHFRDNTLEKRVIVKKN